MKTRCLCLLLAAVLCCPAAHAAQHATIAVGDMFPALGAEHNLSAEDLDYLGIPHGLFSLFTGKSLYIRDIQADVILVEFFNTYCSTCQTQVPVMNAVYNAIQKNPDLRAKTRLIGIGAGNSQREVERFKITREILFPLIPDQFFSLYDAIGTPGGTPFMLILKKKGPDVVVVGTHMGPVSDTAYFMKCLKNAVERDVRDLTSRVREKDIQPVDDRRLSLNLTPAQTMSFIQQSMAAACGSASPPPGIEQVSLASGQTIYRTRIDLGSRKLALYSRLISEKPVCDLCHGSHYVITFDGQGIIRDFTPIHLTKYGNVPWDEYDVSSMRKQLIGRRLKKKLVFDPVIDAVSSATMTSALIFKGINELQKDCRELW